MKPGSKLGGYASIATAMLIFGSIGIFRKYLPVPSGFLAMSRAVIGVAFLFAVMAVTRRKVSYGKIRKNLPCLLISGGFIGINWILLFEAYNHTTVSVATLCYYMAPVFIIAVSPFVLKERITPRKAVCGILALVGMFFVSGVFSGGDFASGQVAGILFGLSSAVFYANVVLMNKKMTDIPPYEKTLVQLMSSAVVMLPYVLACEDVTSIEFTPQVIVLLIIVGVVHTGAAYALYFGGLTAVSAQTAALCSYIDPASALIMSALILGERMDVYSIIGAVIILGSAITGEIEVKGRKAG